MHYSMELVLQDCDDKLLVGFVPDDVLNMTRPMHGAASEAETQGQHEIERE